MKFYFLTDESEKSLAPFFSKRVLETVMVSVVIVGAFLIVFWSRRPLSELIATGNEPRIFFLVFAATLIVNSYVNLCCGGGEIVRKGYHMINYQTDKPTYEMDIDFYRYGLIEFLLHTLLLLLPFLPFLYLAAFSSAVSMITFIMAVSVLYTTVSVLSNVRFFGLLILGQIEYPRLLCSPGANDLFRLRNDLICPCYQSAAASIPVKSKPEQRRLSLCNLYGGCVVCHTYPHTGK